VLTAFGLVSDRRIYERCLGININLLWGIALTAFGILLLLLARFAATGRARPKTSVQEGPRAQPSHEVPR
jgi:hypothetical protein